MQLPFRKRTVYPLPVDQVSEKNIKLPIRLKTNKEQREVLTVRKAIFQISFPYSLIKWSAELICADVLYN